MNKQFSLEAFKSGKKAVTRDGRIASFGGYNPDAVIGERVIGWFDNKVSWWRDDGKRFSEEESDWDLIGMAPEKKTVWVNVYEGGYSCWYSTEELAKIGETGKRGYIGTFPLEIEV